MKHDDKMMGQNIFCGGTNSVLWSCWECKSSVQQLSIILLTVTSYIASMTSWQVPGQVPGPAQGADH